MTHVQVMVLSRQQQCFLTENAVNHRNGTHRISHVIIQLKQRQFLYFDPVHGGRGEYVYFKYEFGMLWVI